MLSSSETEEILMLQRIMTSTPAKTFGMSPRPDHPIAVLGLAHALMTEWKQMPPAMFQNLVERGVNFISVPMILELTDRQYAACVIYCNRLLFLKCQDYLLVQIK